MKCPNCEYSFLTGNVCPECGIDVVIFEKTLKISDVLYNKGLNLARIRDLSGAADSLTKSIQFNKNNYYARNLLGLVYFEVGKIGDAIKEWIISASLVKGGNPASRYIDDVQREPNLLDDYNDAVNMYNSAFVYIQQKSDDLAVIQLKKALEISPGFVDAMNLLTFCYLIQGVEDLALNLVERVLSTDINNPIALNYYNELNPGEKRSNFKEAKENKVYVQQSPVGKLSADAKKTKKLFGNMSYFAEIMSFVIGGVCMLALLYFVYIPGALSDRDKEITSLKSRIATIEESSQKELSDALDNVERLQNDKDELADEISRLNSMMATEDKAQRIALAQNYYNNGEYVEAAKIIHALDPAGLNDSSLNQYRELKTNAFDEAAGSLYNEGLTHFNVENDESARRAFESCLIYANVEAQYVDDVIYYLGQLAERRGDTEEALRHYDTVVEDYPQSNKLSAAKARLTELGN